MFALGNTQILHVTEAEMVKEISTCTSLDLGKPTYQAKERSSLLGNGILTSNGPYWAHQRKIIAPELYMDKVKVPYKPIYKLPHPFSGLSLTKYIIRFGMTTMKGLNWVNIQHFVYVGNDTHSAGVNKDIDRWLEEQN